MPAKREINYEKVAYLARRLVPQKVIACRIGFTETGLSKRKGRDKQLQEALDGSYAEGKIGLYIAQYRKAIDHHYTFCKECHKIADGEFYESCPYCDREDPENAGSHTKVTHKIVEADTQMLIHMGKVHLGQSDKALLKIQSNENHPLAIKNLTEEQVDKKLSKLYALMEKEYGKKNDSRKPPVVKSRAPEIIAPPSEGDPILAEEV
jgi:hypothetical protein